MSLYFEHVASYFMRQMYVRVYERVCMLYAAAYLGSVGSRLTVATAHVQQHNNTTTQAQKHSETRFHGLFTDLTHTAILGL